MDFSDYKGIYVVAIPKYGEIIGVRCSCGK